MISSTLTRPLLAGLTLLVFIGAGDLASSSLCAAPEDTLSALEACEKIDGDSNQLACFHDTLARLKAARSGPALPAPNTVPAPAEGERTPHLGDEHEVRVQQTRESAMQDFGLNDQSKQVRNAEPPRERIESPAGATVRELKESSREPQSISATIAKVRRTAFGKIVVTLDNGQVWRETDGSNYRGPIRVGNEVIISQRRFGGYQMKIEDQYGVVFVRRPK